LFCFLFSFSWIINGKGSEDAFDISPENIAREAGKLAKGKEIFENIKNSEFVETVKSVSKWGLPLLKSIGFFSKVIMAQIDSESKELKYMKEQFKIINEKMDVIDEKFEEVKRALNWNAIKIQYSTYEMAIKLLQDKIKAIANAPKSVVPMLMEQFHILYEQTYYSASAKIYEGITNNNLIFSDNLVIASRMYLQDHKTKVEKFFMGNIQLILTGLEVESFYLTAKNPNASHEYWANEWDKKLSRLTGIMNKASVDIKANWHKQLEIDSETFNVNNYQLGNEEYLKSFYNFLKDKFSYREFFVIVYNPIVTDEKHYIYTNWGLIKFRARGHNIVVGSRDADYGSFNTNEVDRVLNNLPTHIKSAKTLLMDYILPQVKRVQNIGLAAVIEWGAGVWYKSNPRFRSYKKYNGRKTFNVIVMG